MAGVTQDAVPVGGRHVYRFRATQVGTYWYHSHQVSHEQVHQGPARRGRGHPARPGSAATSTWSGSAHLYAGRRAVQGRAGDVPVEVARRAAGEGADHQHRQRDHAGLGQRRRLRGRGRRRHRRQPAHPGRGEEGGARRRRTGRPRGCRCRPPGLRCACEMGGAALVLGPAGSSAPATARAPTGVVRPADLRLTGAAGVRPDQPRPPVRLQHRPSPGLRERQAGRALDRQRQDVPDRADVHGGRG